VGPARRRRSQAQLRLVIAPFLCAYSTQALAQAPARGRTTPLRVDEMVLVKSSHTGSLYPSLRLPLTPPCKEGARLPCGKIL
jgi:hypothetical protein